MSLSLRKMLGFGRSTIEEASTSDSLIVPETAHLCDAMPVIRERMETLLARASKPKGLFVLGSDQPTAHQDKRLITFRYESGLYMLLFTTPFFASDYIQATGVSAVPGFITVERLVDFADKWPAAGVNGFVLNRCPRCNEALLALTLNSSSAAPPSVVSWAPS